MPLNLLAPPLLTEIVIHVSPDFTHRMYVSKIEVNPQTIARICQILIDCGMELGRQHGLSLRISPSQTQETQG